MSEPQTIQWSASVSADEWWPIPTRAEWTDWLRSEGYEVAARRMEAAEAKRERRKAKRAAR